MSDITIEQMGGFVGSGATGSRVHTRGKVAPSALSESDRAAIDKLFASKTPVNANLYYRLTRNGPNGPETVDAPAEAVPAALLNSLTTSID